MDRERIRHRGSSGSVTGEDRVYYRASQMQVGQGDQREREEQEGNRDKT
jgi:hypothetical protein